MSFQIDVHTFLDDDIFNKLNEILSTDINLISVASVDELNDKQNIISNDFSFNPSTQSRALFIGEEVSTDRASITPDSILANVQVVILEIEKFFGVNHTPKQKVLTTFTSVKQYKVTSRFSIGYYTDLINLKLHEKDFKIENYTNILQPLLAELVLAKQASPVEIDLLLSESEALFYINAFSIFIDDTLINNLSAHLTNDSSFYSLKRNDRKGQLQICFTVEKSKSYLARFVFTKPEIISRADLAIIDSSNIERIIDHNNYHDSIVKKVTVKTLKELVKFVRERDCSEETFHDNLDAFPNKAILKILKDDDVEFVKRSVFGESSVDLSLAITATVKESFGNAKDFNEKFFNNIDRNTFKDLVKPENWPLDGDQLKNEIADEVLENKKVNTYDEYVENVKDYVNDKYSVLDEDFVTVKENAEDNIAEEIIRVKGQNVEEFVKSSEVAQMKVKVARMSTLFNKMKEELEKMKSAASTEVTSSEETPSNEDVTVVVKDDEESSDEVVDDVFVVKSEEDSDSDFNKSEKMEIKSAKDINGDDRCIQDLEFKVEQLTKELTIKNDSIELMSRKVDEAQELAASEKKELANLQIKYKEELVKIENIEKELKKYESENDEKSNGPNAAEKLKEAQNEVKKYKQRLKFAQSQIQTLEKAKKAADNKGTSDKKVTHLEKLLDKQKKLKTKADGEIAEFKKENHRLNQENKILSNKIKDLERKLNAKNKTAA